MGFDKKIISETCSEVKSNNKDSGIAVIRDHSSNTVCVIDDGKIRMRFTTVTREELNKYKHPLYSILVP